MSAVEIRADLIERITNMDEHFLKAIYSMVVTYQNETTEQPIGYEIDGTPIYGSVLGHALDKEVEAAKNGNFITAQELNKKSKTWLSHTK